MVQRDLDLLPEAILGRSRAHVRTGRYAAAALALFASACVVVTWSRLSAESARTDLTDFETHAAEVLALEARAQELRMTLEGKRSTIERYHQMELPVRVSSVLSTVINELPPSICLDEISVEAGHRRSTRTPRSTGGGAQEKRQRLLTVELAGFAVTDAEIAELVDRLMARRPFQDVNLDFSRSRFVRERSARAFRMSFRIDLDPRYEVTLHEPDRAEAGDATAVVVEVGDDIR